MKSYNPVSITLSHLPSRFTLKFSREIEHAELMLISITGNDMKRVDDINGKECCIEKEDLSAGVYLILLRENGNVTGCRKMVLN